MFDDGVREMQAPSARPDSLPRALALLERSAAGAGTDLVSALESLRAGLSRRGLLILVSDLYAEPEALLDALQPLAHAGHDLAVFTSSIPRRHVPSWHASARCSTWRPTSASSSTPCSCATATAAASEAHAEAVAGACRRVGADYRVVSTDEPLDAALQAYLRFRERRGR